jgi:trans-2,3-dihydro-3-hydroxyanthranilate isomerase
MENCDYCIVDVFGTKPFQGNPTGVVFDAERLADESFSQVAWEINRSQTAFVYGAQMPDHHFGLRWFSPQQELRFGGQAAIAAIFAMIKTGRLGPDQHKGRSPIYIDSPAGLLTARVEYIPSHPDEPLIWLEVPRPQLKVRAVSAVGLRSALRLDATFIPAVMKINVTEQSDAIIPISELDVLLSVDPDFGGLANWCRRHDLRGICLACTKASDPQIDCHCRYFAPAAGVNEDTATGDIFGPLSLWLLQNGSVKLNDDQLAAMRCIQSDRSGRVGLAQMIAQNLKDDGWVVLVAGQCATTMEGRINVPANEN